jgi:shikimate kinase
MNRHFFLTGFMGVGKTTVGQTIAAELGVPFVDLDLRVVEVAGKSISQIFSCDGESVFRDLESAALIELLDSPPSIVSTGGGIIGRQENRSFMHNHGIVIYLSAEWETLKHRIGDTTGRPLAQSGNDWSATKELWLDRCPLYAEADIIVKTDQLTITQIITEIKSHAKL